MKIRTLTILPLKEEVISVVEELESGGATSVVDNHTNETMVGENFSENVGIEAPVITSPSGQATSDVDDRVKENIMGGKTLMQLGSLNTKARNILSTIDEEEIDDRRINKEVINDRRIDVEDIIKVEDIINVEDIKNIEERNDRRIYTNKEVNIKEIDDKDLNVKKLVDEKVKDNVCSDKPCKGIGNEYSIEERFILEDTYEYEKLEGLGESMERLFDNNGLTDTETYDKGIDETLHNETIGEVHDKTTYAGFCELLLEINTDEEFNAQRDPQKFENLLKGQGLGKKSDGIKEPIQSNNSFLIKKKFKNLIAPVRPYNTRAKSKQNQLPSPLTETTETEHLNETPATIPPPPKYTYLPSPSRERLLLSPSPSPPPSPPPPSRHQLPASPPPPIPLSRSPSPCPSSSSSYDSDEPNPCAVPRPAHSSPLLKIINSRDCLINRKDNLVIFISHQGKPIDKGALEFHEKCKLPKFEDIMPERAKVTNISRGKKLIALPVHYPPNKQNLVNTLKSLYDVVTELEIKSISISKTQYMGDLPWRTIEKIIKEIFSEIELVVIVCNSLVQTPQENEIKDILEEYHSSPTGGHKGVSKTYCRIRNYYFWNNMKEDVRDFINKCKTCQMRKMTRIKPKRPMILTDTPGRAFDKVALDIVGPLPMTRKRNQYILTIQD
ncbi:hypothetical protein M0802_012911 [Mischocyttarus mexicanus]|nr:hypothetical protein M0802_012911 [Mischocyttarus mexicanus]